MLFRITTLLALALAAGLIAAGCGDDDDDTTATTTSTTAAATGATGATGPTGEPLTKDEFIAQADAICESSDKDIEAAAEDLFSGGANPGQAEEEAFVTGTLVPGVQQQLDAIRALTPPEGDEDEVNAVLDSAQEGLDELEDDPSLLGTPQNPLNESTKLAKEYGFEACGQG